MKKHPRATFVWRTLVLAGSAVLSTLVSQAQANYGNDNFCLSAMGQCKASGLLEVLVPPKDEFRTNTGDNPANRNVVVVKCLVLDDIGLAANNIVELVLFDHVSPQFPVHPGDRMFVIGVVPQGQLVRLPGGHSFGLNPPERFGEYVAKSSAELWAVKVLPTRMGHLSTGVDDTDRLYRTLFNGFKGISTADAVAIHEFISASGFPGATSETLTAKRVADGYMKEMWDIAEKLPPGPAYALWRTLNNLRVLGTMDKMFQSAVAAAFDNKQCLGLEPILREAAYYEDRNSQWSKEAEYQHEYPDANRWAEAVLQTPNLAMRNYLLDQVCMLRPDDAHMKSLSGLLNSANDDTKALTCDYFAFTLDKREQMAGRVLDDNFVVSYTRLSEAVQFWRDYWKDR